MGFLENIGTPEIILLAVVLLVIFGPKKLPEFARGLAEASREIMRAFKGEGPAETKVATKGKNDGSSVS